MLLHRSRRTVIVALFLIAAVLAPAARALPASASRPAAGISAAPAAIAAITELTILRTIDGDIDDRFGYSVAIDGQTAVIGTPYDDGPTEATKDAGAAYVFGLEPDGRWIQQTILRAANPDIQDFFGQSVAIDGNTIVVGADYDDGASNSNTNAGAAYVFVRSGAGWTQQAILRADDPDPDDLFGGAVDISGDRIVVGAMQDDGTSDSLTDAGQGYVFNRTNGNWALVKYLGMIDPAIGDGFGKSVAIDGNIIAIGAFRDDGPNNDKANSGSVSIFRYDNGWGLERQINSYGAIFMEAGDHFGGDVALDGETLVVGAFGDTGPSNTLTDAGAAYVYRYIDAIGTWSGGTLLRPAQPTSDEYFGGDVAIDGDTIVVGAYGNKGPSNTDTDMGAAYLFRRSGSDWVAEPTLRASNAAKFDWFGESVAVAGGLILVGASLEDGPRNTLEARGAVYLFFRPSAQLQIPLIIR